MYRSMVGSYTLAMFKKKKVDGDQSILDWARYKRAVEKNEKGNKGSSKDKHFLLPYDGETKINWDEVDDSMLVAPEENEEPVLNLSPLEDARHVIEIGAAKYKRLNQIASTSSVPRPHGNRDKKKRKPMYDPVIKKLVEHMLVVEQYGEVEATRYMRMVTGEQETRDNDDTIRRLPTNMTKSGCYREYGKMNKYKLTRATGCGFKAT